MMIVNMFICDINNTDKCKDITRSFQILPQKTKKVRIELCYRDRELRAKGSKLILDQKHKVQCPIQNRMLNLVVSMGAVVTKVHRIIRFKQDCIIRDYINLHTETRANAKTEPKRDTFNLMNNAAFSETRENPLKHVEARIPTDENETIKTLSKPTLKDIFRYKGTALIDLYNEKI